LINYLNIMQLKTEVWNGWHLISLGGQFVVRNLAPVRSELDSAENSDSHRVALDLSDCTHLDSSAITLIVNYFKRLTSKNGKMVVYGINKDIKEIFSIVGLDRIIPVYSSKEDFQQKVSENVET